MQKFILEKSLSPGNILHMFLNFRKFWYILILEECTSDLILFVFTNCLVVCFNCSKSLTIKRDVSTETVVFQSLYGGQFTLSTLLINQIFEGQDSLGSNFYKHGSYNFKQSKFKDFSRTTFK